MRERIIFRVALRAGKRRHLAVEAENRYPHRVVGQRHRFTAFLGGALLALIVCGCGSTNAAPQESAERTDVAADVSEAGGGSTSNEGSVGPAPTASEVALPTVPVQVAPALVTDSAAAGSCPPKPDKSLGVIIAPRRPRVGEPLHILAATFEDEGPLHVRVERDDVPIDLHVLRRDGPPTSAAVTLRPEEAGVYRVVIGRGGEGLACRKVRVGRQGKRNPTPPIVTLSEEGAVDEAWETRRSWRPREEALFSAWLRELFHAPRGEDLAFKRLRDVLVQEDRNYLYDFLGLGEDAEKGGLRLKPDCADAPYFLRAYFAWKRGLPFTYRRCSRGRRLAPKCRSIHANSDAVTVPSSWQESETPITSLRAVERFFRKNIGWGVHSGNGRVSHDDDDNDFYPVALTAEGVRPGTIYADPYGHIFVVVELMAQQGGRPGVLYAIDGQPDGSITRKRFWAGNFMWNPDPSLGGSGFKRFRPSVRGDVGEDGRREMGTPDNRTLTKMDGYGDVDTKVGSVAAETFFDRMDALVSPNPVDVEVALTEVVDALSEAAKVRVTSVKNGLGYTSANPNAPIEMPWGHSVFETSGPWESFSTPARDLRLLVAMDVVQGFVDRVLRTPEAFGVPQDFPRDVLQERLQDLRDALLRDPARAITYERSNGASVVLTMADLLARAPALEVAYNPNDCVEVRWGAPEGSEERSSCQRRAPEDQQKKVEAYREWFRTRTRPRRGAPGPEVPGVSREAD